MSVGALAPYPHLQFMDSNADPLASGTLETSVTGTSTALATYADAALTTANPTTITLNSAGRPQVSGVEVGVFLPPATAYRFVLKNSAGTTIWTQDGIRAPEASVAIPEVCDGRMTLTSGVPVTVSDVTAATTVYFALYKGNRIALYTSSRWEISTFTELSIALGSDTADLNYDLFAYDNAGVITLERVAWTNATTRATALTTQDGVLVKSGDASRRYLGTYRTTGVAGQCEDSFAKRFCWNYNHRVPRAMRVLEATNTWAYTLATMRQANAAAGNQLAVVVGVAEVEIELTVLGHGRNSGVASNLVVAIGEDSTSAAATGCLIGTQALTVADLIYQVSAHLRKAPAVGYHYYPWLEQSAAAGTTTWAGDDGTPTTLQSGIVGSIEG